MVCRLIFSNDIKIFTYYNMKFVKLFDLMLIMVAERIVLSDTYRIICPFVLCLVLYPVSGKLLLQCSISQLQKIHGELKYLEFFFWAASL